MQTEGGYPVDQTDSAGPPPPRRRLTHNPKNPAAATSGKIPTSPLPPRKNQDHYAARLGNAGCCRYTQDMNFDETFSTISHAHKIFEITGDVMLKEAIKVRSPLLADPEGALTLQQQTALTYVSKTVEQYHCLFGYPSEPVDV